MLASSLRQLFGFESVLIRRTELRHRFRARLLVHVLEGRLAPAGIPVSNVNDSGAGSLRDAITQANATPGPDTITFNPAVFNVPRTINVLDIMPSVTDALTLSGPGANLLTVRRDPAAPQCRLFTLVAPTTLSGLTVTGGQVNGFANGGGISVFNGVSATIQDAVVTGNTADGGGGIFVYDGGHLTVRNSTIAGNTATSGDGGGVGFLNGGSLLLENSTVANNSCSGGGGGLNLNSNGTWTVRNSTISGNTAFNIGGGLAVGGSLTVQNSTIANNTEQTSGSGGIGVDFGSNASVTVDSTIIANNAAPSTPDLFVPSPATVTAHFSLIRNQDGVTLAAGSSSNLPAGTDPQLGALTDNGGPTPTLALAAGSPARDNGSNFAGTFYDQRGPGYSRAVGQPDIGAYEFLPPGSPAAGGGPFASVTTAGVTTYTFQVTYTGSNPINVGTLSNNNAAVQVTGPNGFSQLAAFVGVDNPANGTPRTATYRITAPGGTFSSAANGTYTVAVQPSQVADTADNFVPLVPVGTFLVRLPYVVVNTNNSGLDSLRQAVLDANANPGADAVTFDPAFFSTPQTIALTSGELLIADSVTVAGPGAGLLTARVAAGITNSRVFEVNGVGVIEVTLSGMTISGGNTQGASGPGVAGDGAGLLLYDENLTLDGVTVSNNVSATEGGGIAVAAAGLGGAGSLTVRNSTISGNAANGIPPLGTNNGGTGGGVSFATGGSLLLENSTVSGNVSANRAGGGVYFYGAAGADGVVIRNSTIAGNTAATGGGVMVRNFTGTLTVQNSTIAFNAANGPAGFPLGAGGGIGHVGASGAIVLTSTVVANNTNAGAPDVYGPVTADFSLIRSATGATVTGANNLPAGTDPLFAAAGLANNGGPTRTIDLQALSPLINAGSNPANLSSDQRGTGFARAAGAAADIGAFEVQSAVAPRVQSVMVNDGSAQRSRVTSLTITFDVAVDFLGAVADAFTLARNGGAAVNFTATANVVNGVTVVMLNNFTGNETQSGSFRDGRYTLTAIAAQISANGQQMASNLTFGDPEGLFRFFGDFNGNRQVDNVDFFFFRPALGSSFPAANYVAGFDFDGDGFITNTDFFQFRIRLGTSLP